MSAVQVLVRPPGPELARCELTYRVRTPIDPERAAEQHAAFVAALERAGASVRALPRLPAHPDAPFIEDTAIVLPEVAVFAPAGADSRRGEATDVQAELQSSRACVLLAAPCTLEGGDVIVGDGVLYVGQSTRTNHAGLRALAHAVLPHGWMVKAATVHGALHLKTVASLLGEGRLLALAGAADLSRVRGFEQIAVPQDEPEGACVLRIEDTLVVSASAPRTAQLLSQLGYRIALVEIDEFEKAEAGVTCLALVLRAK